VDIPIEFGEHSHSFSTGRRVLLVNPPAVDLRLPWAEWIEPTGLLKLGAFLETNDHDVRLIDCLREAPRQRERDAIVHRGGQALNRWRFGLRAPELRRRLGTLVGSGWRPDDVIVSSLTSFWWRGVPFVVEIVRKLMPDARIIVAGEYPMRAWTHAVAHLEADVVLDGRLGRPVLACAPAYHLYASKVHNAAICDLPAMGVDGAIAQIGDAVRKGVTRLHLADHGLASSHRDLLAEFLARLAVEHKRTRLSVLGTITAKGICAWPELPSLLAAARCSYLALADNRSYAVTPAGRDEFLEDARAATELVLDAGRRSRTDDYAIGLAIGRPGETAGDAAALLADLGHIAGSVIPTPYQPLSVREGADPWDQNGKLFPCALKDGEFMDFARVLGLAAIVNAKHRSRTFDFGAEDSRVARSVRRALADRAWDPHYDANAPGRSGLAILPLIGPEDEGCG